jgi:hypothetical protein
MLASTEDSPLKGTAMADPIPPPQKVEANAFYGHVAYTSLTAQKPA